MPAKQPRITRDPKDLPPRALENLKAATSIAERIIIAAPTEYRLNSDLPFGWLVVTAKHVVLCNTHRSRGIYALHPLEKLDEIRLTAHGKQSYAYLYFRGATDSTLVVPLKPNIPQEEIDEFREAVQALIPPKAPPGVSSPS